MAIVLDDELPRAAEIVVGAVRTLLASGVEGKPRSAVELFIDYAAVTFSTRDELLTLATKYLYDSPERLRLADAMRRERTDPPVRVSVKRHVSSVFAPVSEVAA